MPCVEPPIGVIVARRRVSSALPEGAQSMTWSRIQAHDLDLDDYVA